VNWALPLTVGNGHLTLAALLEQREHLSTGLLISTGFARMFTLGCSMNCGFVGGFIYPMITIGFIVGVIAHQRYEEDLPIGMTVTCFLAAVPSGICPMPFTLLGISCLVFFLGLQQTVPVFISCIVAYTLFTGIGIFGALQSRGEKKNEADDVVLDHKKNDPDLEPVNKYNVKSGRGSLAPKEI
jgi:H+/Cl- antiporter ClcA